MAKKWALVDVGWGLNCQAALKRIIAAEGHAKTDVLGYYVALAKNHLPERIAGRSEAMIRAAGSLFARRAVVFEHVFTPGTHPSTIGYSSDEGQVVPEFSEETRSEGEIRYVAALHEAVVEYARLAADDIRFGKGLEEFRDITTRIAESFLSNQVRLK